MTASKSKTKTVSFSFLLLSVLMVNQNENENETKFVLVFGPDNQNGLRFVLQEKVTKMNFIFVFVLGYHKDQPESTPNKQTWATQPPRLLHLKTYPKSVKLKHAKQSRET